MAAGILPNPGTKYGPCKTECKHRDCANTREDAQRLCSLCQRSINYETRYYRSNAGLDHALCAERAAEAAMEKIQTN